MDKIKQDETIRNLTMILMYLTRFREQGRFSDPDASYAWKGYSFHALNELDDADYIRQGDHPSRSKKVYLTEAGMERAKELLIKYGIEDR